ncbi:MAG: hypothetical protein ACPHEP_09655 [Acidimicrobiales bacterium]
METLSSPPPSPCAPPRFTISELLPERLLLARFFLSSVLCATGSATSATGAGFGAGFGAGAGAGAGLGGGEGAPIQ